MAQYVDTIKVLFPKFLLACFVGMQTWRQERQKTNKFTMGTSRQMTTLQHKTNPEAHTMLKDKLSVFPSSFAWTPVPEMLWEKKMGSVWLGEIRGEMLWLVCPNYLYKYLNDPKCLLTFRKSGPKSLRRVYYIYTNYLMAGLKSFYSTSSQFGWNLSCDCLQGQNKSPDRLEESIQKKKSSGLNVSTWHWIQRS